MKQFKQLLEEVSDVRLKTNQTLSRIASSPGHPMATAAKAELARRKEQQEAKEVDEISLDALTKKISNSGLDNIKKAMKAGDIKKDLEKLKSKIDPTKPVTNEKTLTPAEKKKREEIAKAIEKDNPDMPMDKKMAIATAQAKKVAEAPDEGAMKRIATTQSNKADRMASTDKKGLETFKKKVAATEDVNEMGPRHTSSPMKDRFGGAVDSKKFGTYKAHMKKHNLDEPTVRMIHKNPDAGESKRMMKNPKYAQAVSLYKNAQRKESTDLTKIRTMLDKE